MALNFPPNPIIGQVYKVGTESWIWNGTAWAVTPTPDAYAPVSIGPNPPTSNVLAGDLWWDSMNGRLFVYYADQNSSQWVAATQIPDPIVEVTSTQVVNAFLEDLTPYVNTAAAIAAGVPNGALFRLTNQTGTQAIRTVIATSGDGVFDNLTVNNTITYGGTLVTATAAELNFSDGLSGAIQPQIDTLTSTTTNLYTLAGVNYNDQNLGTFSGTVIPAGSTIKSALQALETAIDDGQADEETNALILQSGMPALSTNLGTFTGTLIPSASTTKAAIQALETPTDALITLSGMAANSVNLGQFSGSIIPDNQTIKQALQALETSTQSRSLSTTTDALVTLTGVPIDSTNLGTFTGSIINDTAQIKQALQALETATESAPHQVQGNPTEVQFNQAGQFAASSNFTFNTGTNTLFVSGIGQFDAANGETVTLKSSLSGTTYFSVTANGTLTNNGESTFKQRVTLQRTNSESVVIRVSNDDGTSFQPILFADGSIGTSGNVSFTALSDYANDVDAAAGGIAVGQLYRNGSVVQVRVS